MPTHPAGRPGHVGRSRRGPGAVKTARGFEYPTHAVRTFAVVERCQLRGVRDVSAVKTRHMVRC